MYLEIKSMISVIGIVLIFLSLAMIISIIPFIFTFLIIAGIFALIFGDILLGIKITNSKAHLWFDPLRQGDQELCVIQTASGLLDLLVLEKGSQGMRYGMMHKKKIGILNDGKTQFHTRNGNMGFIAHENYYKNIDLKHAKALEVSEGDDIKEITANIRKKGGKVWNLKKTS